MTPSTPLEPGLWIVATPIGTLADFSPRARVVLGAADLIAAEDTRTTRRLLSGVGIAAPSMISLHAHNEDGRVFEVVERAATSAVALVSDAGTPAVSDPGTRLVAAAHGAGIPVRSVPGPSALASALAVSGFPAAPSTFLGFPPRKGRTSWARLVLSRPETLIIFEAPGRVVDLLVRLSEVVPQREVAVTRELSKQYEETVRGELAGMDKRVTPRGEFVLVIGPGAVTPKAAPEALEGLKEIAAALGARWGVSRRDAYRRLLDLDAEFRHE